MPTTTTRRAQRAATLVAVLAAGTLTTTAAAQDTLTIDPGASGILVTVEALGFTDTDTSPISGNLDVITDAATGIAIAGGTLNLDNDLFFDLSALFLGGVTIDVTGLSAVLLRPVPAVPVDGMGIFTVPSFTAGATGTLSYNGFGLAGAFVGSDTIMLDPADPLAGSFDTAQVFDDMGGAVVGAQVNLTQDVEVAEGLIATITLQGQVIATGPYTPTVPCPGDFDVNGQPDIFDLLDYLDRFDAMDPSADLAPPAGTLDIFDVLAFLDLFAGC